MWAASSGHVEVVQVLLEHNAVVDLRNQVSPPMRMSGIGI